MFCSVDWNIKEFVRIMDTIGDQDLVLYGAGKYGRQALVNIKKNFPNANVKYFVDDNRIRNKDAVHNIHVLSLAEVIQELGHTFSIIITNYYVSDVLHKIEENNFDLSKVYFCSELLIEDIDMDYISEHREQLQEAYDLLEDYQSKMIFRTMAEARITKNVDLLCRTCGKNQYFPDKEIFTVGDQEVFVDAGAFDGDTIEQFLELTGSKYKYIYAFEPDRTNYEKLLNKNYNDRIKIFHAGLYSTSKRIHFSANQGGSSKVEKRGTDTVQVYQFDALPLPDKKVTFIKMDIEGSELKALEGMHNTISKYRPKLAICIYHKFSDLWELPLYIKRLVPEYRFYIRNYTTYLDEIVLYATV